MGSIAVRALLQFGFEVEERIIGFGPERQTNERYLPATLDALH
jgi:hypothetical protein